MKKLINLFIIACFVLVGCNNTLAEKQVVTEGYILGIEKNRILVAENISVENFEAIKNDSLSELEKEEISLIYFSNVDTNNLQNGNNVKILFNGNVNMSFPAQASADKIEVME